MENEGICLHPMAFAYLHPKFLFRGRTTQFLHSDGVHKDETSDFQGRKRPGAPECVYP